MGVRAWDAGKSECRPVMGRIGIEGRPNIIPPEREQTSGWSLFAREYVEPSERRKSK
ncbi:MAG: hypothetical protein PHS85_10550 [Sulfurovum sp.]|nr:hypothetical protein [Sulfurovum sp.]